MAKYSAGYSYGWRSWGILFRILSQPQKPNVSITLPLCRFANFDIMCSRDFGIASIFIRAQTSTILFFSGFIKYTRRSSALIHIRKVSHQLATSEESGRWRVKKERQREGGRRSYTRYASRCIASPFKFEWCRAISHNASVIASVAVLFT